MVPTYFARTKSGRCWNGAHREGGSIVHAVKGNDYPSFAKALCGTEPGLRSAGWETFRLGIAVTCPKCIKKLELLRDECPA